MFDPSAWRTVDATSRGAARRRARGRHGRREGRDVRPLPRRPRRRRDPRRAARRRPLAPPAAVPRRDEPLLRRPQREQARRHPRPRGAGDRERLLALLESADIWIETTRPGTLAALGLGPDDGARAQPGARDHVDHRLRPDRRLPRLGGQRRGPRGHERHPRAAPAWPGASRCRTPPGMAYETTAIQAAWATLVAYWNRLETGRGDHVDFSILEAADADHGPRLRRRLGQPRVRPSRRRAGARRPASTRSSRARTATCASCVLAPRQWRAMRAWLGEPAAFQDERYDAITARLEAAAELHALYAALFAAHDEGRDRGRGPGARRAGRAGARRLRGARQPALRGARGVRRRRGRARRARPAAERVPRASTGARVGFRHRAPEPGEHNDDLARAAGRAAGAAPRRRAPRVAPAARRAARRRLRDHRHRQRDRARCSPTRAPT